MAMGSSDGCAVCGDKVNGSRYGAPACLGCIVFFRRSVTREAQYKCLKGLKCEITFESRCICRCCRFTKCKLVGMRPEAIQRRDVMGPRKPKEAVPSPPLPPKREWCPSVASSSGTSCDSWCSADSLMERFVRIQKVQRARHRTTFAGRDPNISGKEDDYFVQAEQLLTPPTLRRARRHDVNNMMRCAVLDSAEWGQSFEAFDCLEINEKKKILQEFGFSLMLIDQGYLTTLQDNQEFWILQNGTYMCADYTRGLRHEELKHVDPTRVKLHPDFVAEAIRYVAKPMREMQIDQYETAALKTLILLYIVRSYPKDDRQSAYRLQSKLINELMDYCGSKYGDGAAERFGNIVLLIAGIRCAVYFTYEQTRLAACFDLVVFDELVRDVFLT